MRGWLAATLGTALAVGAPPMLPPARAAFERPPTGPVAAALGGLLATSDEPAFGNPAPPLARGSAPGPRLAVWTARPFGLAGLREWQSGVALPGPLSLGLGARRFGSETYAEREARLVAGGRPLGPLSIGLAVRGLQVGGRGFAPRRSVTVDGGVRVRAAPGLDLAATAESLVGEMPGDPEGRLARTALGASRTVGPVRICLEVARRESGPLTGRGGVAWTPTPALTLRLGAAEDPAAVAGGATLRAGSAAVSVAATRVPPLGITVRVGVELAPAAPSSRSSPPGFAQDPPGAADPDG